MDECRRSGQIPAFGNWDYANELPITQYFESARQAGLIRYCSSASGECNGGGSDLYEAVHFNKTHLPTVVVPPRKTRGSNSRKCPQVTEQRKHVVVVSGDVKETPKNQAHKKHFPKQSNNNKSTTIVKPVDEDLYKIPPELLHTSKRNKMRGLFSRCLVPSCMV